MISYRQNQDIAWRRFEGDAVLIHPASGTVFVLNRTGSRVWEILEDPRPLEEITARLAQETSQPESRITADVTGFLAALTERNLIATTESV